MLTACLVLHNVQLIHTDIKPENIAFVHADVKIVQNNGTSWKILADPEIRLIDFGSAVSQGAYDEIVTTEPYRAPEVLLSLGWSYPCDIWSIGCVLVELFTGTRLFGPYRGLHHLAAMEAVCGEPVDEDLAKQAVSKTNNATAS